MKLIPDCYFVFRCELCLITLIGSLMFEILPSSSFERGSDLLLKILNFQALIRVSVQEPAARGFYRFIEKKEA